MFYQYITILREKADYKLYSTCIWAVISELNVKMLRVYNEFLEKSQMIKYIIDSYDASISEQNGNNGL